MPRRRSSSSARPRRGSADLLKYTTLRSSACTKTTSVMFSASRRCRCSLSRNCAATRASSAPRCPSSSSERVSRRLTLAAATTTVRAKAMNELVCVAQVEGAPMKAATSGRGAKTE